ncbi:MAG: efflux transporter periplasmic adaptor subunit [Phycisphaerales bacterium]|nr:efflux transporter periplasmic adaptor subunit [Phycisphaerales bacterium]
MTTNTHNVADANVTIASRAAEPEHPRPAPRTTKGVVAFFAAAGLTGVALTAVGLAPRAGRAGELAAATAGTADARRAVAVVAPSRGAAAYELRLPGSTAPFQVTVLYARTSGYLKAFHADIGDRVVAGQLLAEIESPEVDEQLHEARATLEQNVANLALANQRLDRVTALVAQRAAGRGELDDLTAQRNSAAAAVRVSEAVVARLAKDQSYQKVVAPFAGVITQRSVEPGSLVTAGSAAGVTSLFRLEQNDVLKVFVDAPQTAAPAVTVGLPVGIEVREFPGRRFEGKVVRTAGSVDPATRTLRAEIQLPNPKGELMSGMYAQAFLGVQDPRHPVRIPAAALVVDAAGTQVVTVDAAGAARRQPVTLGRDFGKDVEVTSGLRGDERLVVSPRDDLKDGDAVAVR